jgi:hypothetical protein
MYYTGIDPLTMKPVFVPDDYREKQLQRALLQFNRPQNAALVREALQKAGREDLIGFSPECLVRPERDFQSNTPKRGEKSRKASIGGAQKPQGAHGNAKNSEKSKNTAKRGGKSAISAKKAAAHRQEALSHTQKKKPHR